MRVLLVEDDMLLGDGISSGLKRQNYTVEWLQDGEAAIFTLLHDDYELLVLDLGLPKKNGLEVLKEIRAQGKSLPVLILTAQNAIDDRVTGLDAGADDYLSKPFDLDELYARIRALLRRSHGRTDGRILYGNMEIDPAAHQVHLNGEKVNISRREFAVLMDLMENRGRVLSRSRLEQSLYSQGDEVESNAVEVHVHHLRKKLGTNLVKTVRGVGYMIEKESV